VTLDPFEKEQRAAVRAVRDAARICRDVRRALAPELATTKADQSPVTVADYASQALISLALADAFPGDAVIGEETAAGMAGGSAELVRSVLEHVRSVRPEADLDTVCRALDRCGDAGGPHGRRWTIDPVDGTKGFLRNQQYAVALALVRDGQVVLGVLGCPNLTVEPADPASKVGAIFVAVRGGGAWQLPMDDDGELGGEARRIHVSETTDLGEARYTESYESGHSAQNLAEVIAAELGMAADPLRIDSQAKYAVVARGQAEVYLRLPAGSYVEQVWDHAAGSIIVTEAGGCVSDVHGAPLDFSVGRRLERNRGVVAAPAALHAKVVAVAARVLGS